MIREIAAHAIGSLVVELLAPPLREWAERRRLRKRRQRFRQECAGPEAAYCEIHGECWRCCENGRGTCPWHGVQWHEPAPPAEPLTWEVGLAMEVLAYALQRIARGDYLCRCGHAPSEHVLNGDVVMCCRAECNSGRQSWCYTPTTTEPTT